MQSKYCQFKDYISNVKSKGHYRTLDPISKDIKNFPYGYYGDSKKKVVIWCSNDYLGMSCDSDVISAAHTALNQSGLGSGGTRNIGGNTHSIMRLENSLAELHNKESSLVFTSGYVANEATIFALSKIIPDLVIFSDQYNHASIISGILSSKLQKFIYKHLDMIDLEISLKKIPLTTPKIIIFESVYSMSGFISPIEKICQLAKRYNAFTYIDEVHSVGIYGKYGAGIANMIGYEDKIDIMQATLAKSYGVMGGYIASSTNIVNAIRLAAKGFIFTTSLPCVITESAAYSLQLLKNSDLKRKKHQQKVEILKNLLQKNNVPFINNNTHIIPIILGCPILTRQFSEKLLHKYSIFVQHINFPTVPKFTERLRITPTPYHSDEMIHDLVKALVQIVKDLKLNLEELSRLNNLFSIENMATTG